MQSLKSDSDTLIEQQFQFGERKSGNLLESFLQLKCLFKCFVFIVFFDDKINIIITKGDGLKAHVAYQLEWSSGFNHTLVRCPDEGSYTFNITYAEIKFQSVNIKRCSPFAFQQF